MYDDGRQVDSSSYMVSSFHYSPSYSAYRTQNATGVESGHGQWPTGYFKFTEFGGRGQDVNSTGALPSVDSNATPREPSFGSSSNQADDVDASQVSAMPVLCKIGLNVSAQTVPACPICHEVFRRPQERKRHMLIHLPCWLQCPEGGCLWRGDRWENLRRHRGKSHSSNMQEVDKTESIIYDPWPLMEGIKDETTLEIATQLAISLLKERAVEVGKLDLWEGDLWGRKRRKARKVHGPDDDKDLVPKAGHDDGSMSGVNQ